MNQAGAETFYDGILPCVEHPSRYIDRELNLVSPGFRPDYFNVLLVFPDTYGIGMSYQGIRFLYHRLARMEGVGVEFACAPWPDAERMLGSADTMRSLQTGTPACDFDLIGFSLTYELNYTNLLTVLDLAGVPIETALRVEEDPLVVAGGPCCSNPLPFIAAVDAVFLGDGEESLTEAVGILREGKGNGARRGRLREMLAGIAGVYVDGISDSAAARTYSFGDGDLPPEPIVPSAEIVHDRLSVEIQRGCTRGCRYCHAGMINRPRRERSIGEITEAVSAGLDASGWEEVSLLSLSTSDYTDLDELLGALIPVLARRRVSLALPSLRPETISDQIVTASSLVRKSGFTIAPEAGTERLRRVINRGMSNDEILDGCLRIVGEGWQNLKLYFMIGLPTETEEDLAGIVELVGAILALPRERGRFKLNVAVSPFVPKPDTPFQWERQCSLDELREKEEFLARRIRSRRVQLSLRDPFASVLEGAMARGDRRLWPVLVSAYRLGCRFDGWRDRLRRDLWARAFEEHDLAVSDFTGECPIDVPLPWEAFDMGISKRYLATERERAFSGVLTADCRDGGCTGCGACDNMDDGESGPAGRADRGGAGGYRAERHAAGTDTRPRIDPHRRPFTGEFNWYGAQGEAPVFRYRFVYERGGLARYFTHLEVLRLVQRALRRTGWPLRFSEGFHPHPRLSMGPSLPVGTEGAGEFFDIELRAPTDCTLDVINRCLPQGIVVLDHEGPFARRAGKLPQHVRYIYRLGFDALANVLAGYRRHEGGEPGYGEARPRGGGETGLGDSGRHGGDGPEDPWRSLAADLGEPATWLDLADRFLPDAAARVVSIWEKMISENIDVIDRRGKSRPCGGCAVRLGDVAGTLELEIDSGDDGILSPRDLLRTLFPGRLVPLVAMKRLEILYGTEDSYSTPLDLVRQRT
jgi:radical SAM superfamily enzyme YgiQ (UPF0313 family)